ncbi:MAG TPA: efflux transporter outer membrane subunit [Steroidobacter sp.]|nr:efflux transporter outer membrane subunit [Steroidobacter sp.]
MRRVCVLLLSISLAGCIVTRVDPGPRPQSLPDELPAQSAGAVSLPDPWWELFDDETLDELIDEALAHNPDVAIAAARVEQARSTLRIANADRLPRLDAQGDATRSKNSEAVLQLPGVERHRTMYTVQGAVSFELDLWGRYKRASESARAQLLNSEFGREAVKLSLTGEVARGYFSLIAAAEQLARSRDTLASREESLRIERLRYDAGESDEFTFRRAEAEAAAARVSLHTLERDLVLRTNALGVLLGRSPQELVDRAIDLPGAVLPSPAALPAALPSAVLERRPDIGAAEAALAAAAADVGVARAALFPTISLTGAFGSISTELSDLFTEPTQAWTASGGLLQPLFQGGRLRANVARAQAVREERHGQYARTVQTAFREVLDAMRSQELIAGVREANVEQVTALGRAAQLAELRYDQGDIAYLELLDVRRGLFQAQIDLVAAERDALLNTVDLALALGGGLGQHAGPLTAHR